ncbi:MAG: MFS transporter [Bacteroidia bacterium]|jgi:EmrB/QacA subfamily drug resistance transporter|nr:MFS transporter [Bacteroidia bacterium]
MTEQKNQKAVISLLFVGVLMGALDISIVGPAIPSIERYLELGPRFSGWIFSIYVLFNLIGISLFARLSDIYGRRNIYVSALAVFAVGSLVVSLSHSFNALLIGRAIQGFGASGIFPVASALVGDIFPPEKRGRILGLIGAVFGLAFLMGPFIAGVMLRYFEWHFLFIINLPVSLVLIYYSFKVLPSVPNKNISRIDWGGIITLGIALAGFTFSVNNINAADWQSGLLAPKFIFPFSLALISLVVFLVVERRAKDPVIEFSFFSNRQIVIAGIIAMATGAVQACFVFIPKFVVQNFSVTPSAASFMLTPFVLATAIGSPIFGRLIDKYGAKKIVITGLLLLAAGFYLLSLTGGQKIIYYISGVFVGLGLSVLAGSSLRYIILNNTSAEDRATSQGMLTIFISIGQISGTAVIGLLLASMTGSKVFANIFTGVSILLLAMILLSFRLDSVVTPKPARN